MNTNIKNKPLLRFGLFCFIFILFLTISNNNFLKADNKAVNSSTDSETNSSADPVTDKTQQKELEKQFKEQN